MQNRSRRGVLALLSGGLAGIAGCTALSDGRDQDATDTPVDGTQTPVKGTDTPVDGTQTPASSTEMGVERVDGWPHQRGPPTNTGLSATGGPTADASQTVTAQLRDGAVAGTITPLDSNRFPVVGGDAIYAIAGEANPYQQSPPEWALYAYALSREDGSEIWRQTVAASDEVGHLREGGRGLCLGPDGLYVVWNDEGESAPTGVIARLSPSDGSEQWRQTIPYSITRERLPVVRDGRVHVYGRGRVIALDTEDGSELWRTPEQAIRQPLPTVGEDCIVLHHETADEEAPFRLTAVETDDQSIRWTTNFQSPRLLPAIADGTVYVPEASVGETAIERAVRDPTARDRRKIHALSLSDGSERWTHTYDTDEIHQAPTVGGTRYVTVTDEYVYYALGFLPAEQVGVRVTEDELEDLRERMYRGPNVVALDRTDGSVVWRATVGKLARIFQPMIAGPDNLYAPYFGFNRDKSETDIYVIDRESGDVRGSFGPVETTKPFAVADGTLYTHREGAIQAWE
jgi:outer membrane protein assembly factor BamB